MEDTPSSSSSPTTSSRVLSREEEEELAPDAPLQEASSVTGELYRDGGVTIGTAGAVKKFQEHEVSSGET